MSRPALVVSSVLVAALGVVGVALLVLGDPVAPDVREASARPERPAPTPGPFGSLATLVDGKKDQKARRKAWFEELHRHPPDLSWKEIERANGLAQLDRRNALALSGAPPITEGTWVERGSDNQAGRMHAARLGPDGLLYAGSSRGGVWRGTVNGTAWEPLGDSLYGGAHFLEVFARGDEVRMLAATDGGLVHYSDDDGATWVTPTGLPGLRWIRRLVASTDGTDTVYLLAEGNGTTALYRSTDRASSFTPIVDLGWFGDVQASRTGGSELWLVDRGRVSVSTDQGDTWTDLGGPSANSDEAEIAVCEADPSRIYLVLDNQRLFRTDDGGASWTSLGNRSDYWSELAVSTLDPDLFAYGGVELWISRNAGQSFTKKNDWWAYYEAYGGDEGSNLHADIMGLDARPTEDGEIWYIATDGGLYRSLDGLAQVRNLSRDGLRVGQYYDTHTSWANPAHVAAGAQDQGYQLTTWATQDPDDPLEFYQPVSGDYGHLSSSDHSHAMLFAIYPGYVLIHWGEDFPDLSSGVEFPANERYVPWMPPVVADPYDAGAFFFPTQRLLRATRSTGWTYEQYGEDLGLSGEEYLSAFAFSPVDPELCFAMTNQGKVFVSNDHGVSWERSLNGANTGQWLYGQAIAPSWTDPDVVTFGGSGYGSAAVYRSRDGGRTVQEWTNGLPDTVVIGLVEAMDGSGCVFAGTETSAYQRCPDDDAWVDITDTDAPITTYWSAEALPDENTIRFGTYGRGIWDFQMPTPDCYPVVDADGDGAWCNVDCDDDDPARYPDAVEVAGDGIDQDCDGDDPAATDTDSDTEVPDKPTAACGCVSGPGPGWLVWLPIPVLLGRRRLRRPPR